MPRSSGYIVRSRADAAMLEWAGVTASYDNSELIIGNYTGMDYQSGMEYQILDTVWYQVLSEEQLRRAGGPPGCLPCPSRTRRPFRTGAGIRPPGR
jgi:hypothetical protein